MEKFHSCPMSNHAQTIVIGSDHAGFELKTKIIDWFSETNYEVIDVGTYHEESTDYPDFSHRVSGLVDQDRVGILVCGSGNGVAITANKWNNIRAALCWNSDVASLSRKHNDANVLCLPARFMSTVEAIKSIKIFLETDFEGGRHSNRIKKIPL
jgi:ribose 5-phosphate isomerase B